MLENVLPHVIRKTIGNHCILRNEKYQGLRNMYPNIPSHYIHRFVRMQLKGFPLQGGTRLDNMMKRSSI
jgi:hypothetical protein